MPKTKRANLSTLSNLERFFQLQKELVRRLHLLHLTPNLAAALLFLQRSPDVRAMVLGKALGIVPSSATSIIFTLVRKGWVTRIRSSDDYRVVILRMTPRGKKVVREISERLRDMPNVGVWS